MQGALPLSHPAGLFERKHELHRFVAMDRARDIGLPAEESCDDVLAKETYNF